MLLILNVSAYLIGVVVSYMLITRFIMTLDRVPNKRSKVVSAILSIFSWVVIAIVMGISLMILLIDWVIYLAKLVRSKCK